MIIPEYGISATQYHYGLDQLWKALGATGVQEEDVFTLAARALESTYVIVNHYHEPNQLIERVCYSTREQAEAEAEKIRQTVNGLPTPIEVVELKRFPLN